MEYCYSHGLKTGKNFHCFSDYPIDANWPWLITIGDNVTISTNVKLLAHDASTCLVGAHTKIGIISIGNNVFIGAGSIVLCDTRIGDNCIIGAGSVVTHDVPSNSVYAGNPATFICSYTDFQEKHLKSLETHPYFSNRRWNEWPEATQNEREVMRESLKDTFGYV